MDNRKNKKCKLNNLENSSIKDTKSSDDSSYNITNLVKKILNWKIK